MRTRRDGRGPACDAVLLGIVLSLPGLAHAAAVSPPGVNIRWDRCFGDAGVWNKTFACNTNTGSDALVLSFELDTPMTGVNGLEIIVDLKSTTFALPAWWHLRNPGTCRQTALGFSTTPPAGSVSCVNWAGAFGPAAGGIAGYNIGFDQPNTARVGTLVAVPSTALATLAAGQEYFAASLTINHSKAVGPDACAGCDVPVCIYFQRLTIQTADGASRELLHGANWQGSQLAYWQNGYATDFRFGCGPFGVFCYTTFTCVPYDVTHSTRSTWGAVKSLYR